MKTLMAVVRNEYFPAAAVLAFVVLFWTAGLFGGLSLLSTSEPPIATLFWLLFVYAVAVLRRWPGCSQQLTCPQMVAEPPRGEDRDGEPAQHATTSDRLARLLRLNHCGLPAGVVAWGAWLPLRVTS